MIHTEFWPEFLQILDQESILHVTWTPVPDDSSTILLWHPKHYA